LTPIDHCLWAVSELAPGATWQNLFRRVEEGYRRWFLLEGDAARPSYRQCVRALQSHMPELIPTYEALVDLAGGGDSTARLISLYKPAPYLAGCSQAVWTRGDEFLIRNYDYSPDLWDGVLLHSAWHGGPVVAMLDSLWGALDGINQAGLAVSLAFGGRRVVGDGFGMPLILRYVLETCETVRQAKAVLARVPTHMAYNVTVLDAKGDYATAFLAPDRAPLITGHRLATNHQGSIDWAAYATATGTLDREEVLRQRIDHPSEHPQRFLHRFLEPPLYSTRFPQGWGTLYTAVYRPNGGAADYHWPGTTLRQSVTHFEEATVRIVFPMEG
jgi:predicted choloylglycine hydrolase